MKKYLYNVISILLMSMTLFLIFMFFHDLKKHEIEKQTNIIRNKSDSLNQKRNDDLYYIIITTQP